MAEQDFELVAPINVVGTGPTDAEREEEEIQQLAQIRQLNEQSTMQAVVQNQTATSYEILTPRKQE